MRKRNKIKTTTREEYNAKLARARRLISRLCDVKLERKDLYRVGACSTGVNDFVDEHKLYTEDCVSARYLALVSNTSVDTRWIERAATRKVGTLARRLVSPPPKKRAPRPVALVPAYVPRGPVPEFQKDTTGYAILGNEELRLSIPALVVGHFAVHRPLNDRTNLPKKCGNVYQITHTTTGRSLVTDIPSLELAKLFVADWLTVEGVDWSSDDPADYLGLLGRSANLRHVRDGQRAQLRALGRRV